MEDMTEGFCALCRHDKIVRATPKEHGDGLTKYHLAAAQKTSFFGGTTPYGIFVAYICQSCGFTMWFADKAWEIPIGYEHGTELLEGER